MIFNNSQLSHGNKKIWHVDPRIAVSYTPKRDKKKDKIIAVVDNKHEPLVPIKRPKQLQEIKLKKGKINKQRYILEKKIV